MINAWQREGDFDTDNTLRELTEKAVETGAQGGQ